MASPKCWNGWKPREKRHAARSSTRMRRIKSERTAMNMPVPESARVFLAGLTERARRAKKKIVFPEASDPRVQDAAARLAQRGILQPILIGPAPQSAPNGVVYIDAARAPPAAKYAPRYSERRRAKGITQPEPEQVARRPPYFAALM